MSESKKDSVDKKEDKEKDEVVKVENVEKDKKKVVKKVVELKAHLPKIKLKRSKECRHVLGNRCYLHNRLVTSTPCKECSQHEQTKALVPN